MAKLALSGSWTLEERITVASALLGIIQLDICKGSYSLPGRPNITSVLHVLHGEASVLNQHDNRESLDAMLDGMGEGPC